MTEPAKNISRLKLELLSLVVMAFSLVIIATQNSPRSVFAASLQGGVLSLNGGDQVAIVCNGSRLNVSTQSMTQVLAGCLAAIVTPAPTAVPTQTPSVATTTIRFDDKSAGNLTGQYPAGVTWEGTSWAISGPWERLDSQSLAFRSQAITQGTISFSQSTSIVSVVAYNGGTQTSRVEVTCGSQSKVMDVVQKANPVTITTGFSGTCRTATLRSSNGWDTNFDNLVLTTSEGVLSRVPTTMPGMPTATQAPVPQGGGSIGNGNASGAGFGVATNVGKETGINLAAFNSVVQGVNAGQYDRACSAAEHDRTKWHSLVNVEAKCHYDHQHNDDPNMVSDIFGEPGAWFGAAGQSISYPWQTFVIPSDQGKYFVNTDPSQQENGYKHEGYGWVVRRNQDCPTLQPDRNGGNPFIRAMGACVTDFRIQYHFHGNMDATTRFHSGSVEMRVCLDKNNAATCGIYRNGGWLDSGILFTTAPGVIDCTHGVNALTIPIAGETRFFPIDRPESRDEIRCHPTVTNPTVNPNLANAEWWFHGSSGGGQEMRFQLQVFNTMGNIDRNNPAAMSTFCRQGDTDCRFNNSIVSVFVGYITHLRGGDVNGKRVTYVDRWGETKSGCTRAGLDCIPMTMENVKMNLDYDGDGQAEEARYIHTQTKSAQKTDYDISPAGKQWITWFYRAM